MENFFDIHCHILPGIDDGSSTMDETMAMIETAYKDGIRSIVATPHFHPRRGHGTARKAMPRIEMVRNEAAGAYPDLKIYSGCEIYYCHDILEKVKSGEILTLNNSDYVLIEFSFTEELRKIKSGLNKFLLSGYNPILAHVERYDELVKNPETLDELTEAGVYLQINADSLLGKLGGARRRFVKKLLKDGMVSFIASDAHDCKKRAPLLSKAAAYVEKKYGRDTAERIFIENPKKVIDNIMI